MALDAGKKPGPYEVLEPIGKGGMSEVYRARDKANRNVRLQLGWTPDLAKTDE